jgi:hypothetical protein
MPSILPIARLETFPGWEIVAEGLADISGDRVTPAACVIWIAWPRLKRAGLVDDTMFGKRLAEPERVLYRLLGNEGSNAFGRYNSLLRRLVKFEHALDRAMFAGKCD